MKIKKYNLVCKDEGRWKLWLETIDDSHEKENKQADSWGQQKKIASQGSCPEPTSIPGSLYLKEILILVSTFPTSLCLMASILYLFPILCFYLTRPWMVATISSELNSNLAHIQKMEKLRSTDSNPWWLSTMCALSSKSIFYFIMYSYWKTYLKFLYDMLLLTTTTSN